MQKFESKLYVSKLFILFYAAILLGSCFMIGYLAWPIEIKAGFMGVILIYGVLIFWQNYQWQAVSHHEQGWIMHRADQMLSITLGGDSIATSLVSVLRFTLPGKRLKQSCVIFYDAMPKDSYRQLIVRLRNMH